MPNLSQIELNSTTYDLKDAIARQQVPWCTVGNSSTSTVFVAMVDSVSKLESGVRFICVNNKVTSASDCTINVNSLGAKPIYLANASATRVTTQFAVNSTWMLVYNETRVSGGCWDLCSLYSDALNPAVRNENLALVDTGSSQNVSEPARVVSRPIRYYSDGSSYYLKSNGVGAYQSGTRYRAYAVSPGMTIYLKLAAGVEGTYMFQKSSSPYMPTSGNTNQYMVGSVVSGAVDAFVTVPANAYYLIVSSTSYSVAEANLICNTSSGLSTDTVTRVTLPNQSVYEIKDEIGRQTVPYGYVDNSTSSTSAMNAIVPGVTKLRDGVTCYIYNAYSNPQSSSFTLNVNNLGAKQVYNKYFNNRVGYYNGFYVNHLHLLIYDEALNSGAGGWYLEEFNVTTNLNTNYNAIPTGQAIYNYLQNQIPDRNNIMEFNVHLNSGVTATCEYYGNYNIYTNIYAFAKINQFYINENETVPSRFIPYYMVLHIEPSALDAWGGIDENYDQDHPKYYSEMYRDGYYEFQFSYDSNYGGWDVIWYFHPVTAEGTELTANKVTSLSSSSTDTQYPTAKCVYDIIGDVESALAALR